MLKKLDQKEKIAFLIGALAGVAFTRTPYMEDGNLLVTTVCAVVPGSISLMTWKLFKKLTR